MGEIKYFFSYARKDSEFVLKLAKELRGVGVNLWLDQLDILGGQRWDQTVGKALEACQGMIAVLSPQSLASNNVMDEVSYALEEGKLVVPVLLQSCEIPFRLRRVQHVNFINEYDVGFAQLLRALHIEQSQTVMEPPASQQHVAQEIEVPPVVTSTDVGEPLKEQITHHPAAPPSIPATTVISSLDENKRLGSGDADVHSLDILNQRPAGSTTRPRLPPRVKGALVGAIIGASLGAITKLFFQYIRVDLPTAASIVGVAGAIVGAITGKHRRVIVAAIVGMVIGFCLGQVMMMNSSLDLRVQNPIILGMPVGAVAGAIVGLILKKWRKWA